MTINWINFIFFVCFMTGILITTGGAMLLALYEKRAIGTMLLLMGIVLMGFAVAIKSG